MKKIEIEEGGLIKTDNVSIWNEGTIHSFKVNGYNKVDGPACEFGDGDETWYFDGHIHRRYGPARKWGDGDEYWYLKDVRYTQEEFMEKFL